MQFKKFKETIELQISDGNFNEAAAHITQNMHYVLMDDGICDIYTLLNAIPKESIKDVNVKLAKSLLSFMMNDYYEMKEHIKDIDESLISSIDMKILYFTLVALSSFDVSVQIRLNLITKATELITIENPSAFGGFAYFAEGQLIEALYGYKQASVLYKQAQEIFEICGCHYMATIASVFEQILRYQQGSILETTKFALMQMVDHRLFSKKKGDYLNLNKIPLGLGYFELGKYELCLATLKEGLDCALRYNMIYLFAFASVWIIKACHAIEDYEESRKIIENFERLISELNDYRLMSILNLMKIMDCLDRSQKPSRMWIESIEAHYLVEEESCHFIFLKVLVQLTLEGYSNLISEFKMKKIESMLETKGNISDQIAFGLLRAEFHLRRNQLALSLQEFQKAVDLSKSINMSSHLKEHQELMNSCWSNLNKSYQNKIISLGITNKVKESGLEKYQLTEREIEIFKCLGQGLSNNEIAKKLFISLGTTKWHINNIYSKIEVNKRYQAMKLAENLKIV